jgi:hypothetical protein
MTRRNLNPNKDNQIREGFIVDEDEEDDDEGRRERRREKRKRRREEREAEDALLDEEDLDLIGETHPDYQRRQEEQVTTNCRAYSPTQHTNPSRRASSSV